MTNVTITSEMGELTITLPAALLTKLNESIPMHQRNLFVQKAIEELLAIEEQTQALAETAGAWANAAYADLDSPTAVEEWLKSFRAGWHIEGLAHESVTA